MASSPNLDASPTVLRGIGPKRGEALARAGVATVGDLLWHLPRDYQDRTELTPVSELREGEPAQVLGRLRLRRSRRLGGRRHLLEAVLDDGSGELTLSWFNQPYLAERLEESPEQLVFGRVERRRGRLAMTQPELRPVDDWPECRRIVPVYPEIGGLASSRLERWIDQVFRQLEVTGWVEPEDPVPADLLERHDLPTLAEALRTVHRPPPDADIEALRRRQSPFHARLVYGELFAEQLQLVRRRSRRRRGTKPHRYVVDDRVRQRAREMLPFHLTPGQRRVVATLVDDLLQPAPMRRLLQGDVGSGKTVVAALLGLIALESGLQAAYLAPTELLAEQHAETLQRLLPAVHAVACVTAATADEDLLARLADGEVGCAVGTHALLDERVEIPRLALVVIDEEHRFGVAQRRRLVARGRRPDLLVMSATPIPRSLALTAYGDLEPAVLDGLPPGRRPVETEVRPRSERQRVYRRLTAELERGRRAFVVYPVIRDGGHPWVALETAGRELAKRFSGVGVGVLHGELSRERREAVMQHFREGEIRLLLATSIVEVGVDVPQATAMVIESAERFGLAQLHQLRGRVGRGNEPGWCCALHGEELTEAAARRLRVFACETDGFAIAEHDLAFRGPGELLGERQAGVARYRVAELPRDEELLLAARHDAREVLGAGC